MARSDRAPSIRRRLLALLIVPTTLVLLAGTFSDYLSGLAPIRDAYDLALSDAAVAIAGYVRQDGNALRIALPPEAVSVLRADSLDRISFRVSGPRGELLAGDGALPELAMVYDNPAFATRDFAGEPTRLVTYRSRMAAGNVTTTVGETLHKRERVRANLLPTVLSVDVAQLALILGFVWLGVSFALRPLLELRDQVAMRSPRDLAPLAMTATPMEVQTLIGELNRLFATIEESSRAQSQFLESAAHQLRTPLTGVQAQLELLLREEDAGAKAERLKLVLNATRRLAHTTHQLLALARSDHGALAHSEFQPVDLAIIAGSCVSDFVSRAITVGVDLGAELQPAATEGIAWLLNEALGNLIDNAIHYTPTGGSVTVRSGSNADGAFLEVEDTGIGIPATERERVAARFYRGSAAHGTGSGLGLAIAADVARVHGGALRIEAGADGRGTRVRLNCRVGAAQSAGSSLRNR